MHAFFHVKKQVSGPKGSVAGDVYHYTVLVCCLFSPVSDLCVTDTGQERPFFSILAHPIRFSWN